MNPRLKNAANKQGIALVIVLGLLAILLIMAVAFSAAMRTERIATRYYLDGVKARHLVHTALFRVLGEDIAENIQGRVYPDWTNPVEMFPVLSAAPEVYLLGAGSAGSPMRFVPASVRPADWTNRNVSAYGGSVWFELRDPRTDDFYGEYAFLVVNNSGLLDSNIIGARESENRPRQRGFDPGEIRFHSEVLPEAANSSLHIYRNEFRRFESVPELYYLTSTTTFSGIDDVGSPPPLRQLSGSAGYMADHLHVFSRYPRGYGVIGPDGEWDAVDQVVDISGDPTGWDRNALGGVLAELNILENPSNREMFIKALIDYADEGLVPFGATDAEKFQRFSAKPVPMVNEVIVSNTLQLVSGGDGAPDTLRHTVYVEIETVFPFPQNIDGSTFRLDVQGFQFSVMPPYPQFLNPGLPDPVDGTAEIPADPNNPYFVTRYVITRDQSVNADGFPPYPTPGTIRPFTVTINFDQIRVMSGSDPVDVVFGPWPATTFELAGDQPDLSSGGVRGTGSGGDVLAAASSANDPRINWSAANALHWRNVAPTPGARNSPRIDAETGYSADEIDWMYARRGPLQSVGELGYLLYDPTKPWTTVSILDPDNAAIFDRLTVHTNRLRRGLVNINSRQTNALMAAVWQAPVERYPTQQIVENQWVTDSMARQLAEALINETTGANGPMANLSEIGRAWTPALMNSVLSAQNAANDKFVRESVLRNSLGVLGARHNLFTIFVAARVFVDGYDPDVNFNNREDFVASDQRAVAVVWRDPFRTEDSIGSQTYETFIQYFHWITDALED